MNMQIPKDRDLAKEWNCTGRWLQDGAGCFRFRTFPSQYKTARSKGGSLGVPRGLFSSTTNQGGLPGLGPSWLYLSQLNRCFLGEVLRVPSSSPPCPVTQSCLSTAQVPPTPQCYPRPLWPLLPQIEGPPPATSEPITHDYRGLLQDSPISKAHTGHLGSCSFRLTSGLRSHVRLTLWRTRCSVTA